MAENNLKEKTMNGVMWSAIERFSAQGIQFIFNILIARILLPDDYGVVTMLNIFLAVAQVFIDSGFGNALIRKNDRTEDDLSTVFFFNLATSVFFFALLWLTAPLIASFYELPILTKVLRIASISLIINAFGAVQGTKLAIDLDFRKRAVMSIFSIIVMGAVGLWMAVKGFGVWALVAQSIAGSVVRTLFLWAAVHWIPKFRFSTASFKEMFPFGSKLLATSLVDTVWGNIYNIVIGKCFSSASLGNYNRAESFASFPSSNLYGMIQNVLYPSLCKIQDDKERLKSAFRQFIQLTSYIVFPLMMGLAAVADPFIRLVLTDKWADSITLLQLLCFALVLYPMSAINITFPNILGHSGYYLKSSLLNKVVDITAMLITIPMGLTAMCFGKIVASIINLFIDVWNTKKLIGYGILAQFKDILRVILSSLVMGAVVFAIVNLLPENNALRLGAGILAGIVLYLVASLLFMRNEFSTFASFALSKLRIKK